MKKSLLLVAITFAGLCAAAQNAVSIATDVSILRSLSPGQQFWSFGQSVQGALHIKQTETLYAQVGYYTNGNFKNSLAAIAKDAATTPQQLRYTARSALRLRQLSLGWKHYFRGAYNNEEDWNLYGSAGFGLLFGRAENSHSQAIDTALYMAPPQAAAGVGNFKRLTLDLSLGVEMLLGAGIYLYTDVRTWIPASDYPSPFLFNNNLPRTLSVNGGIRVLMD